MPDLKKPTEAELAILRVLWSRGASTVRDVAEAMGRGGAYTTVLKLMQIMTEKGLIVRDDAERAHVYEAACSQDQTEQQLVRDLLDRLFGGSASTLVMQALATKRTSASELRTIRRLVAEAESREKARAQKQEKKP